MSAAFTLLKLNVISDIWYEFWFARDLQEPLGYARWENFLTTIMRAVESCKTTGCDPNDHFRGVRKMVHLGSGAERSIEDFMWHLFEGGVEDDILNAFEDYKGKRYATKKGLIRLLNTMGLYGKKLRLMFWKQGLLDLCRNR